MELTADSRPIANPDLILREEFDAWAILFDPVAADACGFNPVAVFIWKRLDGRHTLADILAELQAEMEEVPADAAEHLHEFVNDLARRGYVGFEVGENGPRT